MIGFGIVGYGFMGHIHAKTLSNMPGAAVVAICDTDARQMDDIPAGIRIYDSDEDLIKDPKVDVVLIAANNDQHKQIALLAANAGKHVLCEKPAALSVADYDTMVLACQQAGITFVTHHQRRFDKDYRTSKAVFDSGTLGDVYTVKSSLYGFNGNMHDWHVYKDQGGGMLYDWGVHLLDQMLWMIPGKIVSLYADLRNVINEEVDDYFKILMKFDNGIMADIELGTYMLGDKPNWFERHWFIGGNKGSLVLDGFQPKGHIVRTDRLLTGVRGERTMTASGPTRSFGPPPEGRILLENVPIVNTEHRDFFDHYLASLRGEQEFLIKQHEVRRVLTVMDAVRQSSATAQAVTVD